MGLASEKYTAQAPGR